MSLERLSDFNSIDYKEFIQPVEPPVPEPEPEPVISQSKTEERAFTNNLQKQLLLSKIGNELKTDSPASFTAGKVSADQTSAPVPPGTPSPTASPVTPGQAPVKTLEQEADEIIKKNTKDGVLWDSLDTDKTGKDLAEIAKKDPAKAAELSKLVLDKIASTDRDNVSDSFVKSLSREELYKFAKTEKGREALAKMRENMDGGWTTDDEKFSIAKIDDVTKRAQKAADFEKSPEYQRLSPEIQREVSNRLDKNFEIDGAVNNLIQLVKNGNFSGLPVETQKSLLKSYDAHDQDRPFLDGLERTINNPQFRSLNATQQQTVLTNLERFANTESYKNASEGINKNYLIDLIAGTTIYSQQNPGLTSVSNTLERILSGRVRVEAYSEVNNTNGWAAGDTIHMNVRNNLTRPISGQVDTFVHEINHIANGPTDAGSPDRFLDEYRARVAGREAGGQPLTADRQREWLRQYITPGQGYDHLATLYADNAQFRAVIDRALADLNRNPPVLTNPEQLRQNLVAAGFNTPYLNTPSNMDNH